MTLSRPALEVLGISPRVATIHPPTVIVTIADAVYRAAISRYHPDKGTEAIRLPSGVDLTELQAARDAVRANPRACIEEITRSKRITKSEKNAEELAERVSIYEEMDDARSLSAVALWDYIAREKLGLNISEEAMEERVAYSTLKLNGVAILVAITEQGKSVFYEHLRHNGTWFKRPIVEASFSKDKPYPPNIPPELILKSGDVGGWRGYFFDQSGPHVISEGFEIIGSYAKSDLSEARAKRRSARGKKPEKGEATVQSGGFQLKVEVPGLSPLVASALKPYVLTGSVLMAVIRDADGILRYSESGVIRGIRVFDQKQRP